MSPAGRHQAAEPRDRAAQIEYERAVEVRRLAISVRDRPGACWTKVILSECEESRCYGGSQPE